MFNWLKNLFGFGKPELPPEPDRLRGIPREALIESLNTLRVHANNSGVPMKFDGICVNVWYYLMTEHKLDFAQGRIITVLCDLFQGWPEHTGEWGYPVPYNGNEHYWEGEHLCLRTSLILYTVAKLRNLPA